MMNILVFKNSNGQRTSITISDLQLDILDRLACFRGISRQKLLAQITKEIEDTNTNVSNYVRDYLLGALIDLLSLKGLDL